MVFSSAASFTSTVHLKSTSFCFLPMASCIFFMESSIIWRICSNVITEYVFLSVLTVVTVPASRSQMVLEPFVTVAMRLPFR